MTEHITAKKTDKAANKAIRNIFIIAIVIICAFTAVTLLASSVFTTIDEDGYAIPASAGVSQALAGDDGEPISLVSVKYDDIVYKKVFGYFVGEDRNAIDVTFPLYRNGGVGLRFLGENNWLITSEVDIYQTYDGLYVSEGVSYNSDMSRADDEKFIFLMLDNGLYMNVQSAVLQNRLGKQDIPINSIILFRENKISWYAYKNGTLGYFSESSLFDATLTIDGVTYDLYDLMTALGLVNKAIEQGHNNKPDPDVLEEAKDILTPNEKGEQKDYKPGDNAPDGDANAGSTYTTTPGDSETGYASGEQGNQGEAVPGYAEDETDDETGNQKPGADDDDTGSSDDGSDGDGADVPGSHDTSGDNDDSGTPGGAGGDGDIGGDEGDDGSGGEDSTEPGDDGDGEEDPGNTGEGGDPGSSQSQQSTLIAIFAKKQLDGQSPVGSEYTFELRDALGSVIQTVNNVDGNIAFEAIRYDQEGIYTYTVSEVAGSDNLTVYDDSVYTVTVTVKKENDVLTAELSYEKDGAPYEKTPKFENHTIKDPAVSIIGQKFLDGVAPEGSEFTFELRDENKNLLETVNNVGGSITFSPITYTQEGAYTYYVSELRGNVEKMAYDQTVFTVVITVAKDEYGILRATQSFLRNGEEYNGTVVFSNMLNSVSGDPVVIPYQEPVVTISDIEPWCYAADMHMDVNDPSSTITRGIKFAVYTKLKGSGETGTDAQGHKTYSADDYTGQSLMLRTTRTGTQDMSLSPLKPGQTVYIQYSYRYYQESKEMQDVEVTDPVTGVVTTEQQQVTVRKRVYYYSDFVEVTVPTVAESTVQPVAVNWATDFAAYADALGLSDLTVANTSGYDAGVAAEQGYNFEYFKLNTLPYVNRMELTLTPKGGGASVTVIVNSSTLTRAQKAPVPFRSTSPKLDSNTEYTCTVVLKDRHGNELPLLANGTESSAYSQSIYTQKQKPSVTITEVENITDSLTLKLKVSDPDSALDGSESLRFDMLYRESPVILYGTWKDGTVLGSQSAEFIELKNPANGAEYEFTIGSLAFARLYTAQVKGTYYPQPDGVTQPQLAAVENANMGQLSVYTASLSTGEIAFTTAFTNVLDTSATLNATMTSSTTTEILPLVDEFRVYLKDADGKVVRDHKTVLDHETLNTTEFTHEDNAIVLDEDSFTTPKVQLYGDASLVRDTPWNSFCIAEVEGTDEQGNPTTTYTVPMQLQILLPSGYLEHFNKYTLVVEAVVIKGGEEYFIPVNISNTSFTTKKTIPKIECYELVVASDMATFVDLRIFDPDATIMGDGTVTAQLHYGSTLLSVQTLKADQTQDRSGDVIDLTFEGLIKDSEYTVTFIANEYNDEAGYAAYRQNHVLDIYDIKGGSNLTGSLRLTSLSGNKEDEENLYGSSGCLHYENSMVAVVSDSYFYKYNGYNTVAIPIEGGKTYELSFINPATSSRYVRWGMVNATEALLATAAGSTSSTTPVKLTASYSSMSGSGSRRLTADLQHNYLLVSYAARDEAEFLQSLSVTEYRYATNVKGYDGGIHVTVNDLYGYLGRDLAAGENPKATLTIERSNSMEQPNYEHYETYELPLTENADGSLTLDTTQTLSNLPGNMGWRATLTGDFMGREIKLDQITFRTDTDYIMVSTHRELYNEVLKNPYANILVTSDFTLDSSVPRIELYGTVDFQGNVVTVNPARTNYFFSTINSGAVVRNLVYDYPPNLAYYTIKYSPFVTIDGTVENLMVRTYGQVEITSNTTSLLAYYLGVGGVLRNFIVKLGGDAILNDLNAGQYAGLFASTNYGTVEDGYVYGVNGAGLLQIGQSSSGLFGYTFAANKMDNVYVLLDNWQLVDSTGQLAETESSFLNGKYSTLKRKFFSNGYTVGDFYGISADGKKSYLLPLQSPWYSRETDSAAFGNFYYITGNEGVEPVNAAIPATVDHLHDPQWQRSVLTSAKFDVEGSVPMGFYPRLKLPTEMQKYQEYLILPVQQVSNVPAVISDDWAEGYDEPGFKEGYVVLRMRNDSRAMINEVTIDNLTTTVLDQSMGSDGIYEVILSVLVDSTNESYVSSYHISNITYTQGSVRKSFDPDYDTKNIEFWKEVSSADDWHAINSNMTWNYKLTADIDFAGVSPGRVILNGKLDTIEADTPFRGKIDGQEHVIKNIRLENISSPSVIYSLSGEVNNLLVENMVISQSKDSTIAGSGFIGAIQNSHMSNIRFRNCEVTGGGNVGTMVGSVYSQSPYTTIENSSATDCIVRDMELGRTIKAGGLFGTAERGFKIINCYTRNVTVETKNAASIGATGGLIGEGSGCFAADCYVHGKIETAGSYAGGLVGSHSTGTSIFDNKNIITYVDILQTAGDYAGGMWGWNNRAANVIALGNVNGAGSNTHRIGAVHDGIETHCYAWEGQKVGNLSPLDSDNAQQLLSGQELGYATTWQDVVRLGDHWDYTQVEQGYIPMLLPEYDCKTPGWQQEKIPLPGQSADPSLELITADYNENDPEGFHYSATVKLNHPASTAEEIQSYYENGNLEISVEGMDLSDAALNLDKTSRIITESYGDINSAPEERYTLIRIDTKEPTMAFDSYRLNVSYNDGQKRELSLMLLFMEPDGTQHINWLEIANIDEWNYAMSQGHGETGENIRIIGVINFGSGATQYRRLQFNRLVGLNSDTCGFVNLRYGAGTTGEAWIEKVMMELSGLRFDGCRFDFTSTQIKRARTAPIEVVGLVSNLKISQVSIHGTGNNCVGPYMAFIGIANSIEDVSIQELEVRAGSYSGNFVAGLAAYVTGSTMNDITAENITVYAPKATYVGGIVGRKDYGAVKNIHVRGVDITGSGSYVGGIAGISYASLSNCLAEGANGKTQIASSNGSYVGGIAAYNHAGGAATSNLTVRNLEISGKVANIGGIIGSDAFTDFDGLLVENCTISGSRQVGGVIGQALNKNSFKNMQIIGCTVTASESKAGGLFGFMSDDNIKTIVGCVARDTHISANSCAGGFLGDSDMTNAVDIIFDRIYVAEDVTVTADEMAGGLIGRIPRCTLKNAISGATVTGRQSVGGAIGQVDTLDGNVLVVSLEGVISAGSVSASGDYAGGLVGKLNSNVAEFTDNTLKNCAVTGSVLCSGNKASLWVNDTAASGSAGRGTVYTCEDAVLNGQSAKALHEATTAMGQQIFVIPETEVSTNLLVPASRFNEQSFYNNTLTLNTGYWDYTHIGQGNVYMPYTKNNDGTAILQYANHNFAGETDGILVPEAKPQTDITVVYASGAGTINIEAPVPEGADSVEVTVNDTAMTTNSSGILTLNYDFASNVKVGEQTYSASDLARKVMTYGDYWYYIKDGEVHYGRASGALVDMQADNVIAGITGAVHLWQGKVLADGGIYTLTGGAVSGPVEAGTNLSMSNVYTPFWSDGTVNVYHHFTVTGGKTLPYRVFMMNNTPYTVAPAQNAVYDGVVLAATGSSANTKRYFATLGENGSISAWLTDMVMGDARNESIGHISNSLGYSGTVLLICYENGDIIGVDYTTGDTVCTTIPQTFAAYIESSFTSLFQPSGEDNIIIGDGSFLEGEEEQIDKEPILIDVKGDNPAETSGTQLGEDVVPIEGTSGSAVMQPGTEESDPSEPKDGYEGDGENDTEAENDALGTTEGAEGDPSGNAQDGNADGSDGTADPNGSADPDGNGGEGGNARPDGGVQGDGTDGNDSADGNTGDGTYQSGGIGGVSGIGGAVSDPNSQIGEIMGSSMLVYSPEAGGYVAMEMNSIVSGNPVTLTTAIREKEKKNNPEAFEENNKSASGNKLNIAHGIGRDLYANEKRGFLLIGIAAGVAVITLAILYFAVIRKRRKQ